MADDPTQLSAVELASAISARRMSAAEVLTSYLERIERVNPSINAVIQLDAARARATARHLDGRRAPAGPLHGVPMTLKDSHRVAAMPSIVGDPAAPAVPAATDGFVAAALRAAGAVIIGKTNVPRGLGDFQTENAVFGRTANPWDPARTPGGSSGGAAAALAARLTPLEVGSDIAGSSRVPAAFCGVIGFKPSEGLISRRGHIAEPVAHSRGGGVASFATIGPMARSFTDVELLFDVLTADMRRASFEPAELSIGVLPELRGLRVATAVRNAVRSVGELAERHGARTERIKPPMDVSEQHDAYVGIYVAARDFGERWAKRRPAVAQERERARAAWRGVLARHDAVLMPAVMCTAFTHRPTGEPIEVDGTLVPYWGLTRYTEVFNLTGLPALAFPVGVDADGLPIGVQLIADHGRDRWLLSLAGWLSSLVDPLPPPM